MKHLVLFFILVSFLSCKTKVPVFEINQEVRFLIPAGKDPIRTHYLIIHDIPSFLNENLERKGLKSSDLTELYAGKGKLESIVYSSNFGVISKISISIYKKGEKEKSYEIYYRDQVPLSSKGELKLLSTGEDVREVLSQDKYEMKVELQFKTFTLEEIECRLTFGYVAYIE